MAHMPRKVSLIENTVSGAPGFQCQNVYVLPGVPSIMGVMFDDLLASNRIAKGTAWNLFSVTIYSVESEIAAMLQSFEENYAGLEIGSYPCHDGNGNNSVDVIFRHRETETLDQLRISVLERLQEQNFYFDIE